MPGSIPEECTDAHRRLNERLDDVEKSMRFKPVYMAIAISILIAGASLLSFSYYSKTDGSVLEQQVASANERMHIHVQAQEKVNARTDKALDDQGKLLRSVSDNIIKIGERWRLEMERPKK